MPHTNRFDPSGRPERRAINSPRRTRISKEPEERRQEIIKTALELFSKNGYEYTTIQDIAERMHVSPGLCYRYFKSKTEIFAAASEFYASRAVDQIRIPMSEDMPALEKLSLFVQRIFAYVMKHKEFEAGYRGEHEIRASRLDHAAAQMAETMVPIIEQGVREGIFECSDVENTTAFLIYGLLHTFHSRMPEENPEEYIVSFHEFAKNIFKSVLKIQGEIK